MTSSIRLASALTLAATIVLAGLIVQGSHVQSPPTKTTPPAAPRVLPDVQSYAVYKRGGKKIAFAFDWSGTTTPANPPTVYFGRDPSKHSMTHYHRHKVANGKFLLYVKTHTDRMHEHFTGGTGVISVQTTDDGGNPVTQPVTVVTIEDTDDTPCDD
jgi:hypothetical protein